MKSILDPSFDYTPSVATDIRKTFERVWRELGERDDLDAEFGEDRKSLWLECTGELVDFESVTRLGLRRSRLGVELVQFVCPLCAEVHESIRFG